MASKKKAKQPRDWHAVAAHFRNSAGSMGDNKKELSRMACRNFKDDGFGVSKKSFEVVAYQARRFVMTVEAYDEKHAKELASQHAEDSSNWDEDCDYYNFSISHAEETEDE
jgi:hypothetical protein